MVVPHVSHHYLEVLEDVLLAHGALVVERLLYVLLDVVLDFLAPRVIYVFIPVMFG